MTCGTADIEPTEIRYDVTSPAGPIAVLRWPGTEEGTHVLFVHATGFCKELWRPVVEEMRRLEWRGTAIAIDQRAHGDSLRQNPPFDWWDLAADALVATDDSTNAQPIVGVGHSAGATALALAAIESPGIFGHLVLIEPIVFPGRGEPNYDHPLVSSARKRKASFQSRQAAHDNYSSKEPFSSWDPRALDAYVNDGFTWQDGDWALKCAPDDEAEFYAAAMTHGGWQRLPEIRCPVTVVAGATSDTHQPPFLDHLVDRFTNVRLDIVPDASHFVPMEAPAAVARIVVAAATNSPTGNIAS